MAANALVRCCFHAYADSAYARHIDSGVGGNTSSVYGTLRNDDRTMSSSNSIEKVEGWRRMASPVPVSGSTLTLDSAVHTSTVNNNPDNSNSADDISIYNGDENHKIWAGSTRDMSGGDDGIYGEYGANTMRSTRSSRPRQTVNAPPPPPPPTKEEKRAKKANKERARRKKMTGGSREEMYPLMNGSLLRSATSQGNTMSSQGSIMGVYPNHPYSNGTVMRPASQMMNSYQPGLPPVMMVPATLPHPRMLGTVNRPGKGPPVVVSHVLPPNFLPMPPHPVYMQTARKPSKHYPVTMEEPIYMPSNRPMSPVSSYQPCHFPHEAYLMQQYATMDYNTKWKGKEKHMKKGSAVNNGRPEGDEWSEAGVYPRRVKEGKHGKNSSMSLNADHRSGEEDSESPFETGAHRRKDKEGKSNKKSNGVEREEDDGESPYNTGIYRRKGHLNERAFSYSIRQEHRSRSYGSLANLKFAPLPVVPNGGGPPVEAQYYGGTISKEEMKKEREIMQMMQDLELSGDELERSEVPASVYQQARQRNAKIRR